MLSKKKLKSNLMLLIFSVMMIWKGFSQTVIDSTQIQLTKPIARLVIIDEKQKQTNSQQELNKLLQLDLKKQKLRTKLTSGAGILLVVGAVVLIK